MSHLGDTLTDMFQTAKLEQRHVSRIFTNGLKVTVFVDRGVRKMWLERPGNPAGAAGHEAKTGSRHVGFLDYKFTRLGTKLVVEEKL
jgi:hypothetical protein